MAEFRIRLHSVRFKRLYLNDHEYAERAFFVTGLMAMHGCYLERAEKYTRACSLWIARYS